jgi:hypothetical protein
MLRRHSAPRHIWRILGSFLVVASVAVVSPPAALANRGPSPYAFEDPDTPATDVAGTDAGKTQNPSVIPPTSNIVDRADPTVSPPLPAVAETDVPGEAVADPRVDPRGMEHGGLAHTGAAGLMSRIAFAMALVAIGFLAKEASRRRRAFAR